MQKRRWMGTLSVVVVMGLSACRTNMVERTNVDSSTSTIPEEVDSSVTEGTQTYIGFLMDNVLHDETEGDIHYHIYIPDSYDGNEAYALFVTLPGYQGLYFQGVGENIRTEEFGFAAQNYNDHMIIVAPQLNDWRETSGRQTNVLTQYMIDHYNIDTNRVYLEGYSGGGETASQALGMNPSLYTAVLLASSQFDGDIANVVKARTPVYMAIGESDEYYGSSPFRRAYQQFVSEYQSLGLSDDEINQLVRLDVKDADYFRNGGVTNQHGGGALLFAGDEEIMGWLFNHKRV